MDFRVEGREIIVELTERNLRTLLSKLGREDSARTLQIWDTLGDWLLTVTAVKDEAHYANRNPGPIHAIDEENIYGTSANDNPV